SPAAWHGDGCCSQSSTRFAPDPQGLALALCSCSRSDPVRGGASGGHAVTGSSRHGYDCRLEQGATSGGLSVMEKKLTDLLPGSQGRHVQLSGRDRWDRDLALGRAAQHEAVGDALHVCFGPGDDPVTCELPEEAGVALDPLTDP